MFDIPSIASGGFHPALCEAVQRDGATLPTAQQSGANFAVERDGALRFSYSKSDPATGEEFWRWPRAGAVRSAGQLIDVSA